MGAVRNVRSVRLLGSSDGARVDVSILEMRDRDQIVRLRIETPDGVAVSARLGPANAVRLLAAVQRVVELLEASGSLTPEARARVEVEREDGTGWWSAGASAGGRERNAGDIAGHERKKGTRR